MHNIINKLKKQIIDKLTKRLSDLEIIKKKVSSLPILILNDFLRDFNFLCFKLKQKHSLYK